LGTRKILDAPWYSEKKRWTGLEHSESKETAKKNDPKARKGTPRPGHAPEGWFQSLKKARGEKKRQGKKKSNFQFI